MAEITEDDRSITEDIRDADYYHGMLPRVDANEMLKNEGDFILRKTEVTGRIILAVSVLHENAPKHFVINQDDKGGFYFEDYVAPSVGDLMNYYRITKKPLSVTCHACLKNPVAKPDWILNHDSIQCSKKLGEGAFGEVYLGQLATLNDGKIKVAVKTMRGEANREARVKFMKEARIMRRFKHPNLVRIFGVAVYESPLMIVMEFLPGGSLLSYVRANKGKVTKLQKLRFITEAAEGMAFLERVKCIHRDVAARNCLLTSTNEVKISDFGMSDEKEIIQDTELKKVPVKWLAKETLESRIYTNKTDVWSFAIMCWEVYSDGAEPYPGLTNVQTRAKIIVQDYRMDLPKSMQPSVAKLVQLCWDKDPKARPDFALIVKSLKYLSGK